MTTQYGQSKYSPRADNRTLIAAFDGVLITSLPRMAEEGDGTLRAAWQRITPGSHGDDSAVKMETAGKKYAPSQRWNPATRVRELIPDAPRWEGVIVLYATARWQVGDVVKVELWESEVRDERREFWRLAWTASPQTNGRELVWVEDDADAPSWAGIASLPDVYPVVRTIEGGPDGDRQRGALMVVEASTTDEPSSSRVFEADEWDNECPDDEEA